MDRWYEILGLSADATAAQIRAAYLRLAFEHHPDRNPDPAAEERFKQVGLAYEMLTNPERRAENSTRNEHAPPKPRRNTVNKRPCDINVAVRLSIVEACDGTVVTVYFRRKEPCPRCREKRFAVRRCALCRGSGIMVGKRALNVQIPPGQTPQNVVTYSGHGHQLPTGTGDLRVRIVYKPNKRMRVEGKDIHMQMKLPSEILEHGGSFELNGNGGVIVVKVPANTAPGTVLRIAGQGIPVPGAPGDLYMRVVSR